MVPSTTWLMLMQGLLFSTAERMKMELATGKGNTPAEKLAEIFANKENSICGGGDIREELTKGNTPGGLRSTNWPRVIKIAEKYLQDMAAVIPKLTKKVKETEAELAKAEADAAFKDATQEDMVPVVTASITQPNTFIDKATALKSRCGFAIGEVNKEIRAANRAAKKEARKSGTEPTLQTGLEGECWENTVNRFDLDLKQFLSTGKVRATSNAVLAACCEVLECAPGIDIPKNYCDELCTRMAGNEALNEVEFLGGSTAELRKTLEELSTQLKDAVHEQKECSAALKALNDFNTQWKFLNSEIDRTFDVQKKAKRALDEADEELEDTLDEAAELEELREAAEAKLDADQLAVDGLDGMLKKLKEAEPGIRQDVADAREKLATANRILSEGIDALNNFNTLKGLVTSTVAKMWVYFQDGLLTHLNDIGLEKGMPMEDYFEKEYESNQEYGQLLEDLNGLTKHCEGSAIPAFELITAEPLKETLLDMCKYTPAEESSTAFAKTVIDIGDRMLVNLQTAQAWHDHPEEQPDMVDKGEPAGLRKIETAFGPTSYFSQYLSRWKADTGDFLKLLASLTALIEQLKANAAELLKMKDQLVMKLGIQQKLAADVAEKLAAAVKKKEMSESELRDAQAEEDRAKALADQQESNVANLKRLFEEAWAAYKAAEKLFEETQRKGTGLS